ncbi:MAG: hypothetical protein HEQ32_08655 [Vampirovibrio sp.]
MRATVQNLEKIQETPSRLSLTRIENDMVNFESNKWNTHLVFESPSIGIQLTDEAIRPLKEKFAKAQPPLLLQQNRDASLAIMGTSRRTSHGTNFVNDAGSMVDTIAKYEPAIDEAILASKLDDLQNKPKSSTSPLFNQGLETLKAMGAKLPE